MQNKTSPCESRNAESLCQQSFLRHCQTCTLVKKCVCTLKGSLLKNSVAYTKVPTCLLIRVEEIFRKSITLLARLLSSSAISPIHGPKNGDKFCRLLSAEDILLHIKSSLEGIEALLSVFLLIMGRVSCSSVV